MYTIKIVDTKGKNRFVFEHEHTKTALTEYLFINYYHSCHLGGGDNSYYDRIRKMMIPDDAVVEIDNIKKGTHCWKIPVTRYNERKIIRVYFKEEA